MRVLKYPKSAYERQIYESVQIQANRNQNILNGKSEFNRCSLPRIGLKLGDKEFKKMEREEKEELAKELKLEQKLKELKKLRGKTNGKERASFRGQPAKKKDKAL